MARRNPATAKQPWPTTTAGAPPGYPLPWSGLRDNSGAHTYQSASRSIRPPWLPVWLPSWNRNVNSLVRGVHLADPLRKRSRSRRHAKYRSELQELAEIVAEPGNR